MNNSGEIQKITNSLNKNPMFRLSLGSKELFHSNFLEFLWMIDKTKFIQLLRTLTGNNNLLPPPPKNNKGDDTYTLSREKENFDLCIFHKQGNKYIYDVVIENKVKSIPHKSQLDDYVSKVRNKRHQNGQCSFVLLSLMENFSERSNIDNTQNDNWKIVSYEKLRSAILQVYISKTTKQKIIDSENTFLITKYLEFIFQLQKLQQKLYASFLDTPLFDADAVALFKKYRLHDFYIKLSCALFADKLKEVLRQQSSGIEVLHLSDYKYKQLWETGKNTPQRPCILLHEQMMQGAGSVGVSICPEWDDKDSDKFVYEIIIQGNQYRHCVASSKSLDNVDKLWNAVKELDYMNAANIPEVNDGVQWHVGQKDKEFCTYDGDYNLYVYKYLKIGEELNKTKVSELIDIMAKDVIKTYQKLKEHSNNLK